MRQIWFPLIWIEGYAEEREQFGAERWAGKLDPNPALHAPVLCRLQFQTVLF